MTAPALARSRVGQTITRSFRPGEQLRAADGEGGGLHFSGYATVWDEPYELRDWWGDTYQEVMRQGCFSKSLSDGADVRLLLNHTGIPLARTKSGTLTVTEDDTGLLSDAPGLDGASPLVQEIRSAMQRGDLDEMSLAFIVVREVWSPDFMQVDVTEARLIDVSVVTYPANPATSAGLRSLLVPGTMNRRQAARALASLRRSAGDDPDAAAIAQQVTDALGVDEGEGAEQAEPAETPAPTEDAGAAASTEPADTAAETPASTEQAERSYPTGTARARLELEQS